MRVIYLTEEAIGFKDSLVRGGAIHVRNVVRGLRDRGHEVHLVDWNDAPDEPFQHSVDPPTRFVAGPAMTLRQALAVGRRVGVDVVVSKTRKVYLPGLLAARRLGVPHVVHVGTSLTPPTDGWVDRLDSGSFRARLRMPHDGYLTVCEYVSEQLRGHGVPADRIHEVGNAVDTAAFRPDAGASAPDPLAELEGPLVGFVGGLHDYKGVHDLATAIERAETEYTVVVAGDGPERARLERRLGNRGRLLGAVPYESMPAVYDALDVFVLPSWTEGLPRVVLEAQAAGVPVVATTVGGVPEAITDGETGLLVPPRDPGRLAAALDRLVAEPDERRRLGDAGRATVTAEFSWSALRDRYETALGSLLPTPDVAGGES